MNQLQTKRANVRRLENELTKAREKKQKADAALASRLAQIEASEPKLPEGVIASFEFDPNVRTPRQFSKGPVLSHVGGASFVEVDGKALAEKEAARVAHSEYCDADTALLAAKDDLSNFERTLRKLKDQISCLEDL